MVGDPELNTQPASTGPYWDWTGNSTTGQRLWTSSSGDYFIRLSPKDLYKSYGFYSHPGARVHLSQGATVYVSLGWRVASSAAGKITVQLDGQTSPVVWQIESTDSGATWGPWIYPSTNSCQLVAEQADALWKYSLWKVTLPDFGGSVTADDFAVIVMVTCSVAGTCLVFDVTHVRVYAEDPRYSVGWPVEGTPEPPPGGEPEPPPPGTGQWWDPALWSNGVPPLRAVDASNITRQDQVVSDPLLGDSFSDGVTLREKKPIRLWVRGGTSGFTHYDVVVNGQVLRFQQALPSDPLGWTPVDIPADAFNWRWMNDIGVHVYDPSNPSGGNWWDLRFFYEPPDCQVTLMSPTQDSVIRHPSVTFSGAYRNFPDGAQGVYRVDGGSWELVPGMSGNQFYFSRDFGKGVHTVDFGYQVGSDVTSVQSVRFTVDLSDSVPETPGGGVPEAPADIPLTGLGPFLRWLDIGKGFLTQCFSRFPAEFSTLMLVGLGVSVILRILGK